MICFQILKEALKYNGSESNPGNQQVCVNNLQFKLFFVHLTRWRACYMYNKYLANLIFLVCTVSHGYLLFYGMRVLCWGHKSKGENSVCNLQ